MSRFFSKKYSSLVPYVPGEQPRVIGEKIKLNTNENPYPPSQKAIRYAAEKAEELQLYSDTQCTALKQKLSEIYKLGTEQIMCSNGSDECLDLCFQAFCDEDSPAIFADITYGFYKVFSEVNLIPYRMIPLKSDFTIDPADYYNAGGTIFIANPNAPTGIALSREEIVGILNTNQDHIVVIDEAYVDFGAESCVPLISQYPNLLVTMTFSKSRSMAGARLGFIMGQSHLIADLETIRNSRNPYNVNALTQAAGLGTLEDEQYTRENCEKIIKTRRELTDALERYGFEVLPSSTNFVYAKHAFIPGKELYNRLKARQIFIRHFDTPRQTTYNRITVGTPEQIRRLLDAIKEIQEELQA